MLKKIGWITFVGALSLFAYFGMSPEQGGCDSASDTYTLFSNATATGTGTVSLFNSREVSVQVRFTNATSPTVAIAGSADNGSNFQTFTTFATGANGIYDLTHKALTHMRVTVTKTDTTGVGARKGKVSVSAHIR